MNTFFAHINFKTMISIAVAALFCIAANAQCTTETTWNGIAWSNGTPTISKRVIISGNYTSSGNLSACNLSVINGAQVTFIQGNTLTVENEINVNNGSALTINSNASLVQVQDTATNRGNITVKRNSSSLYRLDYTLWSSPVTSQNLSTFSPQTSATRFYEYQYAVDTNTGITSGQYFNVNAATTNFQPANAYLIRMPNTDTLPGYNTGATALTFEGVFIGTPNNGVITKGLTTVGERYTSVGNPYASPININAFFEANSSVLDPGAALYFWRKKNETNAGSYATITRDAYVYNHADGGNESENQFGGEQWDDLFNVSTPEEEWVINTGQGFIVKGAQGVSNPVLTFNNSMRRGDVHNNQFFRNAQQNDALKSRIWINLKGNEAFSQTAIVYSNSATLGIDYGRDGKQIASGAVAFYSIAEDTNLTIQARPEFNDTDMVRMGYLASTPGTFTINLHRADGVFSEGQEIFIKDNVTGDIHNLATDYTFTTVAGTFNNRFELIYRSATLSAHNPVLNRNQVVIYKLDNDINIVAGNAQITNINIYDLSGKKLYNKNNINATQTKLTGLQTAQEVIIVEINTNQDKIIKRMVL